MAEASRSSSVRESWVRIAIPSVADLIFLVLLCLLVFTPLSVRLLGDAGIGWHIRTGQQILATHAIPRVDSFSSTMGGKPWFAWEWLYDLIVGELEATLGLNGVVWFTAVVIAGVFARTFQLLIIRETNLLVALVLVLLAISASMIHFLARPHVVSWLFTLAWFWILASSEQDYFNQRGRQGRKRFLLLPLLMLAWVNLHGGFLVGFVLLGIFWLAAVWRMFSASTGRIEGVLGRIAAGKLVKDLTEAGLLSAAASLVNPYGWKLHAHIYSYLTNRFLMDHIDEFQSPNFHGLAQRCFLLLLLITIAVLAVRGQDLRVSEGLTVLFGVYTGLYAARNIPVSSLMLVMVVGPLTSSPRLGRNFFNRMLRVETRLRGHLWPIAAIVVTFWIAANGGRVGSSQLMDAHFDPKRMPVGAVNYLERQNLSGPVLSSDYWGGYLIYRLYPKSRVVVDDRHDLYGEDFLKSYLKLMHGQRGWDEFLQEHEASCILLPSDSALGNILLDRGEWRAIYRDEIAIAFVGDRVGPQTQMPSGNSPLQGSQCDHNGGRGNGEFTVGARLDFLCDIFP